MNTTDLLPLIGIPIVVLGFAFQFNPLLVVTVAGLTTGLATGMDFGLLLETFGEKFVNSRALATFILILPVVGLLESYGLRERSQDWIASMAKATSARILMLYFIFRQGAAALGLTYIGGQAQTVRPLLAPMVEGAATARHGELPPSLRDKIRAHAAACDNVAVFFGEDIFLAFGAILLIHAFLKENGITNIEPLTLGMWSIPTALCALTIHMTRLVRLDAAIAREYEALTGKSAATAADAATAVKGGAQ